MVLCYGTTRTLIHNVDSNERAGVTMWLSDKIDFTAESVTTEAQGVAQAVRGQQAESSEFKLQYCQKNVL
jgi:hypothetical protein